MASCLDLMTLESMEQAELVVEEKETTLGMLVSKVSTAGNLFTKSIEGAKRRIQALGTAVPERVYISSSGELLLSPPA